jgi:hypothetical protein
LRKTRVALTRKLEAYATYFTSDPYGLSGGRRIEIAFQRFPGLQIQPNDRGEMSHDHGREHPTRRSKRIALMRVAPH